MDLAEILLLDNIQSKVSALKEKSVIVPEWGKLLVDYEPMKHAILDDKQTRIDKVRSDGTVEKASRIVVGLEKLLTKRVNGSRLPSPCGASTPIRRTMKCGSR